jgi:hypothetical protein
MMKLQIDEPRNKPEVEPPRVAVEIGPGDEGADVILPRYRPATSNIGILAATLTSDPAINTTITEDMGCCCPYEKEPSSGLLRAQGQGSDMSLNSSIGSKVSGNYWNGTINSVSNRGGGGFEI